MLFLLLILLVFPDSGPGVVRLSLFLTVPPAAGLLALAVRGMLRKRTGRGVNLVAAGQRE